MPFLVTGIAMLKCSFGAAPMPLSVLPKAQAQVLLPLAGMLDSNPMANVPPLAICSAMGLPQPCVPKTVPWLPGKPTVLVASAPAVSADCKLMCALGGMIQIVMPGQTVVQV
jgi:hypothetical protein